MTLYLDPLQRVVGMQWGGGVGYELWVWLSQAHWETLGGAGTSIPYQVPGRWLRAAGGWDHWVAIRDDGSLWAWGGNDRGQLGVGDRGYRAVPTMVSPGPWLSVAAVPGSCIAVDAGGALWRWGRDSLSPTSPSATDRLSPLRVSATGWVGCAASDWWALCAVRADGRVWCYSDAGAGYIGGDVQWQTVSGYGAGKGLGVAQDGTLRAWGTEHPRNTWWIPVPPVLGEGGGWSSPIESAECFMALDPTGALWGLGSRKYAGFGEGWGWDAREWAPVPTGVWVAVSGGQGSAYPPASNRYSKFGGIRPDGSVCWWGANAGPQQSPTMLFAAGDVPGRVALTPSPILGLPERYWVGLSIRHGVSLLWCLP